MIYFEATDKPELYAILCSSKLMDTLDLISAGNERGRHIPNLLLPMLPVTQYL